MNKKLMVYAAATLMLAACERQYVPESLSQATSYPSPPDAALPASPQPVEAPAPAPGDARMLSQPEMLTDAAITGNIEASLATDPDMGGADVSVNTDKGVVHLTGTVQSQEQAAIASAHAQREDGVMRIDNSLAVGAR
jgi:hypothetical protein